VWQGRRLVNEIEVLILTGATTVKVENNNLGIRKRQTRRTL
jgi:hypothetical protein